MTSQQLITKYLNFFKQNGHQEIPNVSLVPENDPTALFNSAGMQPLTPYFLGESHCQGKKLVGIQRCIRTIDIDEVGDDWHNTFFEMLGNWSLGDYFRKDAIKWAYEFLISSQWLNINPDKLSVTVFAGDKNAPKDEQAAKIWQKLGIPKEKIYFLSKTDNWWGPIGKTGPCGPDSEIFYNTGNKKCSSKCQPGCSCGKYSEIWNLVFMRYDKTTKGEYKELKQKNIDTGMGVERTLAILNNDSNVYQTELFKPIINLIEEKLSGRSQDFREVSAQPQKAKRIIADHIKAAVFILMDGITPSNLDQGYVLRRLIRRAALQAKLLEIKKQENVSQQIASLVINIYKNRYPKLLDKKEFILKELGDEEDRFEISLSKGLRMFKKIAAKSKQKIKGIDAFHLYDTYGFPIELTQDLAANKNLKVDREGFKKEFKKHQELSRKGAAKKFKGGLADHTKATTKLHTATHLLHQTLRQVLGSHVEQQGSNINPKRLRFDFTHQKKLTSEQLRQIEQIVNQQIQKALPVNIEKMTVKQAKEKGAIGLFEQKYGDKVKVYFINNFSCEICNGPHVKNTKELGKFKIKKEESSSSGIRRIKAVLE